MMEYGDVKMFKQDTSDMKIISKISTVGTATYITTSLDAIIDVFGEETELIDIWMRANKPKWLKDKYKKEISEWKKQNAK